MYIYDIYSRYGITMNIIISNASSDAIYEQIEKQVKNQIVNGSLTEGQLLPSIRSLARELQVSVITTKRAYDDLERDGFINTVNGKGTFVAAQNRDFLRETRRRMVEEKIAAAIGEAKLLGIPPDEFRRMTDLLYGMAEEAET